MPSIKMSLLALAGAAAAVPHYGGHSRYHKPSGAHGTGAGKPYPTGGWGGFNSTRVPQPTGGNGGYPEGETTIDTTTTSTTTLLKTVTLKASPTASSGKAVVENVTPGSGDKCGPATITVTATDKVTVTVTPGGGADVPKSSAPVAVSKDNGGGYSAPAASKPAESYPTQPAQVSSKPAAEPTPVPSKPVEAVSSAAPSATPSKAPSNGGNSYSGSKRGLAYNEAGLCKTLGGKFGFGYNWGQVENNDIGTAFIPMMHGPDKASSQEWLANVDKAAKKGSKAVMGFNEPDHSAQANLSPEAACSAWKEYMNPIASSHPELTIIGPSVTNGPAPMGLAWLTNFHDACPDAVVHATNIHFYDIYESATIDRFKAQVEKAAEIYGKPVWVTETGWPVSGPTMNLATANVANSKTYWDQVGCSLFGTVNTWWYTIYDGTPAPSFGIVGSTLSTTPLFDLTCPAASASSAVSSAVGTTLATSVVQTAPTQAVTASATATQVTTGASAPVSSLATAPGVEGGAGASQTQVNSAPATTAVTSAAAGTSGVAVSQISDGQVQAPGPKTTTGAVVSQISDGQVQAPTASVPVQSGAATATSGAAPSSTTASKSCPAALTGTWEYPHLIVPVDKDQPSKAYGTQYFGTINSHVSTIFNFDIPASYAGKTCSLIFLFPTQDQLETSSFTYSGEGGIDVYELSSPATEQTTYSNAPSGMKVGSLPSVKPGNSYTVTSHECGAGQRVSFEFEATGSFALNYFQDYNPSPIGAYISAC